jgi:hypothetical protein
LAWMPALWVKAQKPVMGLLNGVLISTASATKSSIWTGQRGFGLSIDGATHLLEHVELVLALDVLGAGHDHAGEKTAKGRDTVTLTNCTQSVTAQRKTGLKVDLLPRTLVSMWVAPASRAQ